MVVLNERNKRGFTSHTTEYAVRIYNKGKTVFVGKSYLGKSNPETNSLSMNPMEPKHIWDGQLLNR